jgi:hypothetical protein
MAYYECLPTRLNPLAERTGFSQASSWEARQAIWGRYESYIKGHLWFLRSDPSVPSTIRDAMGQWGWPKDEFAATGPF